MVRPDSFAQHENRASPLKRSSTERPVDLRQRARSAYVQAEVPARSTNLIDQMRDKFAAASGCRPPRDQCVYDGLMADVVNVKDLGSGVINGKECDHLAFRAKEADWQIWIAQGGTLSLSLRDHEHGRRPGASIHDDDPRLEDRGRGFRLHLPPPAGATKLDAKDAGLWKTKSDLPENYRIGAGK